MVEPVHSVLLFLSPFLPPRPVPNSVSVESTDEALPNRIATNSEREREREDAEYRVRIHVPCLPVATLSLAPSRPR